MEDLENISQSYINDEVGYFIIPNETYCCIGGIWFVENESQLFGIEDKIRKLNIIINKVLNKLSSISYDNKKELIESIKEKQDCLEKLPTKYNEIAKNFIDYDKYYRENLFEFYREKYENSPFMAFNEKRLYLSVMNDIQFLLKKKFDDYCKEYSHLRDLFFEINNYIIKVKKLFKFED